MQGKLNCAIYTRVSTDNQAAVEFNSCEAQEAKIRAFIKSQESMEVFKVYSDAGYTGANLDRPELQKLLEGVKEHKINLIISYKIDRLTRSPKDFYQLIEWFDKYGVDFISVTERFDTSTSSGRLLRNIMLTFAQFERELASERTRDKMLQRAQKGMWNGGIVPFGYKVENKRLVLDKKEAETVRNIYDLYISSGSLFQVYSELKTKGAKYRTGLPFSKSAISYILRNILYIGKLKYSGKISQGQHPPIISEELFALAQEIHKRKKPTTLVHKELPLAGVLQCQECDSYMTPCFTNKKKRGRTKRYYYYRCTKTLKRDWYDCQTRHVSAPRLENYIFQNLERISRDKQYIESLIFKLNNSQAGDRRGLELPAKFPKISPEIFGQTLEIFVKALPEKKGTERNLWVKNFIKTIRYSPSEIALTLYCKIGFEDEKSAFCAAGRAGAADGRRTLLVSPQKINPIPRDRVNHQAWLPG